MFKSVDFPQPLGPTIASISFSYTSKQNFDLALDFIDSAIKKDLLLKSK